MNFTLQYPWLLLLLLPTVLLMLWRCGRAGFSPLRSALYAFLLAGLILILAGPVRLPQGDRIPIVYLVDLSDSIADSDGERERLNQLTGGANATELRRWSDSQGWLFGRSVAIAGENAAVRTADSRVLIDRTASLYGGALEVLCRFAEKHPDGCALLVGDGLAQDLPTALLRAAELRRYGWSLDVLPVQAPGFDDGVLAVDVPPSVAPAEAAPIRVRLQANGTGGGTLHLELLDGDGNVALRDSLPVAFAHAGEQAVQFAVHLDRVGVYRVVARLKAGGDGEVQNQTGDAQPGNDVGYQLLTVRTETVEILHVADTAKPSAWGIQTKYIAEQFPDLHWNYTQLSPKRFAALGAVPRKTRLLVLENIPRSDLPAPLWRSINEFVQVDGGGLLALGGDQAFGAGGHKPGEAFERCLPIKMEPPKNKRIDIVLIVDISASMADLIVESSIKTAKLDAAKEAVWGLLGGQSLLGDDDRISLIVFSDQAEVRLPFTPVKDALTIKRALAQLEAQGSTRPAPAVRQAFDSIKGSSADKQFLIFVSDGQPSASNADSVDFASAQNAEITTLLRDNIRDESKCSFWPVFIGDARGTEPYRRTLADFARFGRGKFIWPQSAGNQKASDLDAATLAGALRAILDEGNKDRFISAQPFLIGGTGRAHPIVELLAKDAPFGWRNRVGIKGDAAELWQALEVKATGGGEAPAAGLNAAAKPEPLFAAGHAGNGRSAAVAMRFNDLALQARKENPRLADAMIEQVRWLTGANEPQTAVVDLRPADAATAQALHVAPGERVLNLALSNPIPAADTGVGAAPAGVVHRVEFLLRPIPMAETSSHQGNFSADGSASEDAGQPQEAVWISPGRFAAVWPVKDPGAGVYALDFQSPASTDQPARALGRATLAVSPGPEYMQTGVASDALLALATAGGGTMLDGPQAADQWRWRVENQWRASLTGRISRQGQDLRPWLAALLVVLVLADSAGRWLKVGSAVAPAPAEPPAAATGEVPAVADKVHA